jgi:hypothetical protein
MPDNNNRIVARRRTAPVSQKPAALSKLVHDLAQLRQAPGGELVERPVTGLEQQRFSEVPVLVAADPPGRGPRWQNGLGM